MPTGSRKRKAAALLLASSCIEAMECVERPTKRRRMWISEYVKKRDSDGFYVKLMTELCIEEPGKFQEFLRMSMENFEELLQLVSPRITKKDTHLRKSISASQRLAITLRFIATGESFHSLGFLFRVPQSTISSIVPECLDAIYSALSPEYLKMPSNEAEWESVAEKFKNRWNFPNCLGAIDDKHVVMAAPPNSGTVYYNYKGTHSIVLLAIVDAEYRFLYVDVGCNGRVSDGGIFNKCSFAAKLANGKLRIPQPKPLPHRDVPVPYVFVADDAFAIRPYIMKPYSGHGLSSSQRVFNFRLSHARRIVENAFGILSSRFRVFRNAIQLDAAKTRSLTLACCALHNYLSIKNSANNGLARDRFSGSGAITAGLRNNFIGMEHDETCNIAEDAQAVRNEFKNYFMEEGNVQWQMQYI